MGKLPQAMFNTSQATVAVLGCGADVGSNLLLQHDPANDGFRIGAVITRASVPGDDRASLEDLTARLQLADPRAERLVGYDLASVSLLVGDLVVPVHFRDLDTDDLTGLGPFDVAVIATHRSHIRSAEARERVLAIADTVVGVAESADLPLLLPPLGTGPVGVAGVPTERAPRSGAAFVFGSCQCVGWAATLRGLIEASRAIGHSELRLARVDTDIVHPDTASSTFGTAGVGARREDARDNLRPGHSQLGLTFDRFPGVDAANGVSLRALTQPPGYQLSRFLVHDELPVAALRDAFRGLAEDPSTGVRCAERPIGSRAYALSSAIATVLLCDPHLRSERVTGTDLWQVTTHAFIHNTIGYSRSVLDGIGALLRDESPTVLPPHESPVTADLNPSHARSAT